MYFLIALQYKNGFFSYLFGLIWQAPPVKNLSASNPSEILKFLYIPKFHKTS